MKQIQFSYNSWKIFKKSSLIWFIVFVQIGTLYFSFNLKTERALIAFIALNIVLSSITVPSLIVHFNHLFNTIKTTLTIQYETISLSNKKGSITLKTSEINHIILHEGPNTRVPWRNHSWFELIDIHGNKIKVSCYLLEISELWRINLSRKISSENVQRKRCYLLLI